ncbi:lysoplasmalogenase [Lysobacter sp. cf310]|uniref:lysoplasmalogenase n=1 Tax=Lysobacter sp. cf310 TaxID=1761790 RepID=UPI0008E4F20A|nr:lysoplasmalogenase [Lysobacter sp. cf310]SFK98791.1 Uncharacterized membrane protein YhhN [Lysobacter sp. cf310]
MGPTDTIDRAKSSDGGARYWLPAIALASVLAIVGAMAPLPWLHYLAKPSATLLVLAMVWRMRTGAPTYRPAILIGLALSTLGDVFLMLPGDWFVFGLGSFLCAHLAYLVAFTRRARAFAALWPFLAYAALAAAVLAVLWPHLPSELRVPVVVYVAVLAAMAAQAAALWWRQRTRATALAALGGLSFVISDASLAIDRFAAPFASASVVVLATYWLAQTWIGLSVRER